MTSGSSGTSGYSVDVSTSGSVVVTGVSNINFVSGATVVASGTTADVTISGGGGGGVGLTYSQTLFVDIKGNDTTAELGNLFKPWRNIKNALQDAANLSSVDGTRYTVHVWSGYYDENIYGTTITLGVSGAASKVSLHLENGVEWRISSTNDTPIITMNNNSTFRLSSTGKESSLIVTNFTFIKSIISEAHNINIDNVKINSTQTQPQQQEGPNVLSIIDIINTKLTINNSTISFINNCQDYRQLMIKMSSCRLFMTNSYLSMTNTWNPNPTVNIGDESFLIFDSLSINDSARMRIHRTSLNLEKSDRHAHFILTDPLLEVGDWSGSILLDGLYLHTGAGSAVETLWNAYSSTVSDNLFLGLDVISKGNRPSGQTVGFSAWNVFAGSSTNVLYNMNTIEPY